MRSVIEQYLRHRARIDGLTRGSIKDMRSRLASFEAGAPDDIGQVQRRHVIRWLDKLHHLAPATRSSYLATVRVFFAWCVDEDIIDRNPCRGIKAPKVPTGVPKRLHADEVRALIDVVRHDTRTLLVVLLMLQEGLRRGEVAAAQLEDIDMGERTLLVHGKGSRERVVPITIETWSVLTRYRAEVGHRHGPVIRSKLDPTVGVSGARLSDLVTEAMVAAGVKIPGDRSRTCHSTRHTAAHDILAQTQDVRAVQQALGHQSVQSTEIYLRGQVSDLRAIMAGRSYLDAA